MGMLHKILAADRKYTAAGGSAPAFKSFGNFGQANGSATSISVPYPASVAANDIAILILASRKNIVPTFGSGFTGFISYSNGLYADFTDIAWKRCDGTEGGTSVSTTVIDYFFKWGRIFLFSGCVASGNPYEGVNTAATIDTGNSVANPSITTTGSNRLGVHLINAYQQGSTLAATSTPAAGWTENSDADSIDGIDAMMMVLESKTIASASTEPSSTSTLTRYRYWNAASFALRP